jgi:hypothetical protein
MTNTDPFANGKALQTIVKNLEKRWGLSLVSFLPPDAQRMVVQIQNEITRRLHASSSFAEPTQPHIEFYHPSHLHSTHLTLTRSDPSGPVNAASFVKEGHELFELFQSIQNITSQTCPIKVVFNSLAITYDGLGMLLLGECANEDASESRKALLQALNRVLPESFNLSRRSWDTDLSKYHALGCRVGFLKRPPPQGYGVFVDSIENLKFIPIVTVLESITLVHHRYRTLEFPQEGSLDFPFGQRLKIEEEEFARRLNLASSRWSNRQHKQGNGE